MPSRRDFHRLTVAAAGAVPAVGWLSGTPARAGAAAEPTVTETSTQVTVDNGPVRLVVAKSSGGRATSLRLNGREPLGGAAYDAIRLEVTG